MLGFPVELALGHLSAMQAIQGIATQVFWIGFGFVLISGVWGIATRRFTAVGG